MACNKPTLPRAALLALLSGALLAGCSVSGKRESPLSEITRGSPTVLDIYRGNAGEGAHELAMRIGRRQAVAQVL